MMVVCFICPSFEISVSDLCIHSKTKLIINQLHLVFLKAVRKCFVFSLKRTGMVAEISEKTILKPGEKKTLRLTESDYV